MKKLLFAGMTACAVAFAYFVGAGVIGGQCAWHPFLFGGFISMWGFANYVYALDNLPDGCSECRRRKAENARIHKDRNELREALATLRIEPTAETPQGEGGR